MNARTAIRGILGLTKDALGVGVADPHRVAERRRICAGCPELEFRGVANVSRAADPQALEHHRCGACGCFIRPKTRLAAERCPRGRW